MANNSGFLPGKQAIKTASNLSTKFMDNNEKTCINYSDTIINLKSDSLMILSDVHVPFYDADLMKKAMKLAVINEIDTLVLNGDFLNCGIWSNHGGFDYESWDHELEEATKLISLYREIFKKCYWILGNHEIRYLRESGWRSKFKHLVRQVGIKENDPWCVISENSWLRVNDEWTIAHSYKDYSNIPGATAERLYKVDPYSYIIGHEHHQVLTTSPDGKHILGNVGTMLDENKVAYQMRVKTKFRRWTPGFMALIDNIPYQWFKHELLTNFDFWMNIKIKH